MKFHHVAVAVNSIEEAHAALSAEAWVAPLTDEVFDPEQRARLRMLDVGGMPTELVEDEGSGPVAAWLKRGCRLYHVCFQVDDLDQALDHARARGCAVVSDPKPAVLFAGRRVAFVLDRILGLVELLEEDAFQAGTTGRAQGEAEK